jgi:hypothetical protein
LGVREVTGVEVLSELERVQAVSGQLGGIWLTTATSSIR